MAVPCWRGSVRDAVPLSIIVLSVLYQYRGPDQGHGYLTRGPSCRHGRIEGPLRGSSGSGRQRRLGTSYRGTLEGQVVADVRKNDEGESDASLLVPVRRPDGRAVDGHPRAQPPSRPPG